MFGIGAFELFAILVIAMIILGPERLPKAMGTVGGWIRELRRLTREFRSEFDEEIKMLQGELDNIRVEAELTRTELESIRSDIEISMTEVQGDLEQVGEDIKEEFSGLEEDLRGESPVPTANADRPAPDAGLPDSGQKLLPAASFADPADAMYSVIVNAFSTGNGELTGAPQSVAAARDSRPDVGVFNIGTEWEQLQSAVQTDGTKWERPPANRPLAFSPQNDQFGAILRAVAESGEESVAAAQNALEYQASLDASELAYLNGREPAGLAFAWASQRQAVLESGAVEIDADNPDGARVRLHSCPYGLTGPEGLAACELSNAYDRALAAGLGFDARYETRITEQASFCELVITRSKFPESESEVGRDSIAEVADSVTGPNGDETAAPDGGAASIEPDQVEASSPETG